MLQRSTSFKESTEDQGTSGHFVREGQETIMEIIDAESHKSQQGSLTQEKERDGTDKHKQTDWAGDEVDNSESFLQNDENQSHPELIPIQDFILPVENSLQSDASANKAATEAVEVERDSAKDIILPPLYKPEKENFPEPA